MKELADGTRAVGLFNRGTSKSTVHLVWKDLGFREKPAVRDLWLREDLGRHKDFDVELPPHGCVLLKVK